MRVFCDLNVIEQKNYQQNLSNVKQLVELGYHTIALNRTYELPVKEKGGKDKKNDNQQQNNVSKYISGMKNLLNKITDDIMKLQTESFDVPKHFKVLSRLTINITEQDQLTYFRTPLLKPLLENFDLIAIHPKTEKVFRSLMEGKVDFDIVAFPTDYKVEFPLSRHLVGLGMNKGLVFEVNYSNAIKSQSLRRYVFMNAQMLISKTKHGQGVILSSGGDTPLDFRSPQDIANLSTLFGLTGSSGLDSVSLNAMKCADHAAIRRLTFKGAVKVEKITESEAVKESEDDYEEPTCKKRKRK